MIFLDEPTSGLDSFTAFVLIGNLRTLASKGKTVIFTIHQPSSDIFMMFDRLFILAQGKFIYQGPTRDGVQYFSSIGYQCPEYSNPADYFIDLAHPDAKESERFNNLFKGYEETLDKTIQKEISSKAKSSQIEYYEQKNSWGHTFKTLTKRSNITFKRNPMLIKARIGQTLFMSFLISSLYFQLSDGEDQTAM